MNASRPKGHDAIVPRYGSTRSFVLRTLYSWLTLTMLYLFPWPLLVIYAGAAGVPPEETPAGWFQFRFLVPLLIAALAIWLWRLSPVPTGTIDRGQALLLFRHGHIWPQALVFLLGTILVISGFLLVEDPVGSLKLMSLALVEALVIQVVNSGYLHGAFDLLLDPLPASLGATGLYALTFAIRAALAVASEETFDQGQLVVALAAGLVVGAIIGAISSWLRARSGSLLPGLLALWLTFLALGLPDVYEGTGNRE